MPQVANLLFRKSPTLHRKSCFTHPPQFRGSSTQKIIPGKCMHICRSAQKNQVANSHPLTWKLRWGVKYQKHFCYDSHGMCRSSEKNHFSSPKPIGVVVRGSSIKNILLGIVWTYTHVYISAFFILALQLPIPSYADAGWKLDFLGWYAHFMQFLAKIFLVPDSTPWGWGLETWFSSVDMYIS